MSALKTRPTEASVDDFLAARTPAHRREDAREICAMMQRITGASPVLWGPSIVGFGAYTYVNTTGKPAEWPLTGFSPRKTALTLYIMAGFERFPESVERLGTFKTGASCLYLRRLADVDQEVLATLITESVAYIRATYPTR